MYDRILLPTDGSDGALAAAETAIDLAQTYDATIHVLYVVDVRMSPVSSGMDHEEILDLVAASDRDPIEPILDRAADAGVETVDAIEVGVPHREITQYARDNDIDVIVMGTHGRTGIEHALVGSVAERVVRTAEVPVITVPMR